MMGGAELFIHGDIFNEEAGANQVIAVYGGQDIAYPEMSSKSISISLYFVNYILKSTIYFLILSNLI